MFNEILVFLIKLSENNNKDWFQKNRTVYEKCMKNFSSLVDDIISGISKFDRNIANLSSKDCIFRIYRDVRFSKNKSPFKTNFGAYISKFGKKGLSAGYYIHIEPNNCFLAGGIYKPDNDTLRLLREEIYYNYQLFEKIINDKNFKKLFHEIEGEKLHRPPKGFPDDFIGVEYLKYKSFTIIHSFHPDNFSETEFIPYALKIFKEMKPFNDFFNTPLLND